MKVIPFPNQVCKAGDGRVIVLPAVQNSLAVARAIATALAEVNTAASFLVDAQTAVLAGAPMTELVLGNREYLRALLTAAAHGCIRSEHAEDRELHWALQRHLRQMDASSPP